MIRLQRWAGMLTYVSKYFLPPGAATEQTNMTCLLPGQLTVRGGMADASNGTVTSGQPALEMYGYSIASDTRDKVFVFTRTADGSAGTVAIIDSPDA